MCAINDGNHFFRPMVRNDLEAVKSAYPQIQKNMIDDVYAAMTDSNTIRPAVMLVILEGINRIEGRLTGNSSYGAVFAYSALQIRDGGNGKIFHRFQDPIMEHIHDAMLQFALAERNMRLVQEVLTGYGYNLTHFCDCGCGITYDGSDYMRSAEYRAVNMLRSYGESIGAPVSIVENIDDIPLSLTDMHQDEIDGYKNIWSALHSLPVNAFDQEAELSSAFEILLNMKGVVNESETDDPSSSSIGHQRPRQVAQATA